MTHPDPIIAAATALARWEYDDPTITLAQVDEFHRDAYLAEARITVEAAADAEADRFEEHLQGVPF